MARCLRQCHSAHDLDEDAADTGHVARDIIGDRKGIRPVKNPCHLSPKFLFRTNWRKKTSWKRLLNGDDADGGGGNIEI